MQPERECGGGVVGIDAESVEFALHANEFGPRGFVVFVEPIGEHESRQIVFRGGEDRFEKRFAFEHGFTVTARDIRVQYEGYMIR